LVTGAAFGTPAVSRFGGPDRAESRQGSLGFRLRGEGPDAGRRQGPRQHRHCREAPCAT